jgi:glutathione S-transferase
MKLWHCAGARSFRPLWMLEEMGLPYELELLPFPPRWLKPEYLEVNPLGTIPFFVDGDVRMTESTGICQYLGEVHGPTPLIVGAQEPDFGLYLNLMFQSDATFTFPQTLVLRYTRLEPPEKRQPKVAADYAKWFHARMRHVEDLLGDGRAHLAAGRFTAADIAVGYAVMLAETLGLLPDLGPATQAWWARLKTRDGFRAARAREG